MAEDQNQDRDQSGQGKQEQEIDPAALKAQRLRERKAAERRDRHRGGPPPYKYGGSGEAIN